MSFLFSTDFALNKEKCKIDSTIMIFFFYSMCKFSLTKKQCTSITIMCNFSLLEFISSAVTVMLVITASMRIDHKPSCLVVRQLITENAAELSRY